MHFQVQGPRSAPAAPKHVELHTLPVEGPKRAPNRPRRWMTVSPDGSTGLFTSPKLDISAYAGVQLQMRDLRLLDPLLATSYPSAILTRNGAVVANLETIKMVVTTEKAFLTNLEDETVAAFATELCRRLSAAARQRQLDALQQQQQHAGGDPALQQPQPTQQPPQQADSGVGQLQLLPFELQVVEVALEMVCARLERLASDLEAEAHPLLDAMTAKVTQTLLESERRVKNKLVRLAMRVETLKEVLEKLLDDEDDMRDMNLSAVAAERLAIATRRGTTAVEFRSGDITPSLAGSSLFGGGGEGAALLAGAGEGGQGWEPSAAFLSAARTPARADSVDSSASSEWEDAAVEVVETLLQSFFFTVDSMHDRLRQLQEYVQDTEDLVAMELDNARNALVRLDMVLTCFTTSTSFTIALATLFSMNLKQHPSWAIPDEEGVVPTQGPYWEFVVICCVCGGVAVSIMTGVMMYARWRRLI